MRDIFQAVFAKIFRDNLIRERERLELTQDKMSELLLMSLRSYADLEHGYSSCGTLTFVLFLLYCCEDRLRFLKELEAAMEDAYVSV